MLTVQFFFLVLLLVACMVAVYARKFLNVDSMHFVVTMYSNQCSQCRFPCCLSSVGHEATVACSCSVAPPTLDPQVQLLTTISTIIITDSTITTTDITDTMISDTMDSATADGETR
ncbi:unnamed protein product [Caenorhabditis nigoni]